MARWGSHDVPSRPCVFIPLARSESALARRHVRRASAHRSPPNNRSRRSYRLPLAERLAAAKYSAWGISSAGEDSAGRPNPVLLTVTSAPRWKSRPVTGTESRHPSESQPLFQHALEFLLRDDHHGSSGSGSERLCCRKAVSERVRAVVIFEPCTVTKTIPSYLRLHSGPVDEPSQNAIAGRDFVIDTVSQFWKAYTDATGWRVDRPGGIDSLASKSRSITAGAGFGLMPAVLPAFDGDLIGDSETQASGPTVTRDAAQRLAAAAAELAQSLEQSQAKIRDHEAEMAATSTPTGSASGPSRLVERLERTLRIAVEATRCDAAGLYLLDDDTSLLKLRASYGLAPSRLFDPARPLRGSRGDLESLVQDVVLIPDLDGAMAETWCSPEPMASAIVVRVEEDDLPIGTLWLWTQLPCEFDERAAAAAKLASINIATELARGQMVRERRKWSLASTSIRTASQWQLRQLPPAMELAPGYLVDGWTESPLPWARSWHTWDVLPDGTIAVAMAEAAERQLDAALIGATARAAFSAHSNYRHGVGDMLSRINDSLWQTNTGDQLVSMIYARVDPDNGEGEMAYSGSIQAIIASRRGFRPLYGGDLEPLASRVDFRPQTIAFRLQPGEVLIGVTASVLDSVLGISQAQWAGATRDALGKPGTPILATIRRALASQPLEDERGGVMLLRGLSGSEAPIA